MAEESTQRRRDPSGSLEGSELTGPEPAAPGRYPGDGTAFIPKCITDKKYPLAIAVLATILIIVIIAWAANKSPPCPSCPPPIDDACPDAWYGFRGKCYYFSLVEKYWNDSQRYCSSVNASLAVIDAQQDLDFLLRLRGPMHYWIGLCREQGRPWKWPNGTDYDNRFLVRGEGDCVYVNANGLSSSRCASERNFICNQPDACARRRLSIF